MPGWEEIAHPGAGTLYVYGALKRGLSPSSGGRGSRASSMAGKKGSKDRARGGSPFPLSLLRWEDLLKHHEEPQTVPTSDALLRQGIAEYTHLPQASGGVLGRGKFSTVYKVLGADGIYYALKHTPLYPHHPLISARLLREPTLLAEIPSHPCLIGVEGWVKTEGHFYLIEQYAASHIPLSSLPLPLRPSRAAYILDQLVSVIRDTLHEKGRVCHRDLKGDNVLIDSDTGEILILDLGLATRFSASEPKLTTCCGSPAFHSPEIVQALARPPGEVTYYGPELDIWCIALVLLSLLLQVRFPLGPKHTSTYVMRERVKDRLQELDEMYPPHAPWRPPRRFISSSSQNDADPEVEKREWARVRQGLHDFLEIDGKKRMDHFKAYQLGEKTEQRVQDWQASQERDGKKFKSVTFVPTQAKYTLPIYLEDETELAAKDKGRKDQLIMRNPSNESERRVQSYIKYLLRSAGILYHLLPSSVAPTGPTTLTKDDPSSHNPNPSKDPAIFQLVVTIPEGSPSSAPSDPQIGWFPSLFSFHRKTPTPAPQPTRSASLPPSKRSDPSGNPPSTATSTKEGGEGPKKSLRCYIKLEIVPGTPNPSYHSPATDLRRGSAETLTSFRDGWGGGNLAPLQQVNTNTSTHTTVTATSHSQVPGPKHNYAFPPPSPGLRSVSASRPNPSRPAARRSMSHAPPHATRPALSRVTTSGAAVAPPVTTNGSAMPTGLGVAPLSPLSRMVSLPSSPTTSQDFDQPLSRAPSRASSRSRKASSQLTFGFHHPQRKQSHDAGAKAIIHLSDPRAYHVLRAALDVKPSSTSPPRISNNGSVINGGHDGLSPLTPMTTRRPSLAPSLSMSVVEQVDRTRRATVGDGRPSDSETDPEPEPGPEPESKARLISGNERGYSPSINLEEERGRPRSKEDASSMPNLQKVKSRNSAKSKRTIGSISGGDNYVDGSGPEIEAVNGGTVRGKHFQVTIRGEEVDGDGKGDYQAEIKQPQPRPRLRDRERDRSKSRSRGLFDVLFGRPNTPTSVHHLAAEEGITPPHRVGYGRAARSSSTPPYMGVNELAQHHHF